MTASEKLPDVLAPGLRLIFVGTAAGRRSASLGAYYAHPGNRFWRTLHEIGLTPRRFDPSEFGLLLAQGIGFTDIAKGIAGMDHEIPSSSFDVAAFTVKLEQCKPKAIAFTSKKAASVWLNRPTGKIHAGRQVDVEYGGPVIFALPSPSGAASRHWTIEPWRDLAKWLA